MAEESDTNAAVDQGKVSDALETTVINTPLIPFVNSAVEPTSNKIEQNEKEVVMAPVKTYSQKKYRGGQLTLGVDEPV